MPQSAGSSSQAASTQRMLVRGRAALGLARWNEEDQPRNGIIDITANDNDPKQAPDTANATFHSAVSSPLDGSSPTATTSDMCSSAATAPPTPDTPPSASSSNQPQACSKDVQNSSELSQADSLDLRQLALWPKKTEDGIFELVELPNLVHNVAVKRGAGQSISGDELQTGLNTCVLFDSTCVDAVIIDVTSPLTGGIIVCYGSGCHVTFTNVHFKHCMLVVLNGAHATLHNCSFTHPCMEDSLCIAVYAHACGTCLHMHDCELSGGSDGISVHAGALATVNRTVFSGQDDTCIYAAGAATTLKATECKFRAHPNSHSDDYMPEYCECAVQVKCGASAEFTKVSVADANYGISVYSARLTISNSSFREIDRIGVAYQGGSTGEMYNCMLLGQGPHADMQNVDSQCNIVAVFIAQNSEVKLKDIKLLRQRGAGIGVVGSRVGCEGLTSQEGGRGAFMASDSYVELTDLRSIRDGDGVSILRCSGRIERGSVRDCTWSGREVGTALSVSGKHEDSSLSSSEVQVYVKHFEAHGGEGNAVLVSHGASVWLEDCELQVSGEGSYAMSIEGVGTVVEALRCHASGSGDGFTVVRAAQATLKNCTVSVSNTGYACYGGKFDMEQCMCVGAEACVWAQPTKGGLQYNVQLKHCHFEEFGVYGVRFKGKGVGVLQDCRIECSKHSEGDERGLYGVQISKGAGAHVTMKSCLVRHALKSCVNVNSPCTLKADKCEFLQSSQHGVAVTHHDAEVALSSCVIKGCGEWAVVCFAGALDMQMCSSVGNGCDANEGGGFCVKGFGTLVLHKCSSYKDDVGFMAEGETERKGPRVQLSEVLAHRSRQAGYHFRCGVRVEVRNCAAVSCGTAGFLIGEKMQLRRSISDCTSERSEFAGCCVQRGANITLQNVRCVRNKGMGFKCEDRGSRLSLKKCESVGCGMAYKRSNGGVIETVHCVPAE